MHNRKLAGDIAESELAKAVFTALKKGTRRPLRSEKAERKAILAFYKERQFKPVWAGTNGLNSHGEDLLEALARAPEHGLTVANYRPPALKAFGDVSEDLFRSRKEAVALEVGLTVAALKFARHASGGQIVPEKIGPNHDIETKAVDPGEALKLLAAAEKPGAYLDSLHPTHPLYLTLKARLNGDERRTRKAKTKPGAPIPGGRLLVHGAKDKRIGLISQRLAKLGLLKKANASANLYDARMERAVKKFQRAKGLQVDGYIGRRTLAALNGKRKVKIKRNDPRIKQKLALNMERLRWLPRDLGNRHIIVNQAAFQAQVVESGRKVHQMRVIIGKPRHPTPLFSDEMETVVFNPYWYVPRSILGESMLRASQRSPGYLNRRGFEVLNHRGKQISSSRVKWWKYNQKNLPYNVRQRPGRGNALGEIKFLFPNKHSVYMHDTPSRHLFKNRSRAFSHGCVRVQDPRKFAEVVLGWNSSKVRGAVAAKKNRPVKLEKKLPVHMTYFTLWLDDDGDIGLHNDVYGRDKALKRALDVTRSAWGGKRRQQKVAKKRRKKRRKSAGS